MQKKTWPDRMRRELEKAKTFWETRNVSRRQIKLRVERMSDHEVSEVYDDLKRYRYQVSRDRRLSEFLCISSGMQEEKVAILIAKMHESEREQLFCDISAPQNRDLILQTYAREESDEHSTRVEDANEKEQKHSYRDQDFSLRQEEELRALEEFLLALPTKEQAELAEFYREIVPRHNMPRPDLVCDVNGRDITDASEFKEACREYMTACRRDLQKAFRKKFAERYLELFFTLTTDLHALATTLASESEIDFETALDMSKKAFMIILNCLQGLISGT